MWELYERRLEAEHHLGPMVRAQALIDRLMSWSAEANEEMFRAALDPLPYFDLRAACNRLGALTAGLSEGDADAQRWQPRRERLLALHAISRAILVQAAKARTDHLTAQDAEFLQACVPIDQKMEKAFGAAYTRQATDADAAILAAAAREYQVAGSSVPLSQAGRRQLWLKRARVLDGLARACETIHRSDQAMIHFDAAASLYDQAGEAHLAASCRAERDAAAQRQKPDADIRLVQLYAALETARPRSIDRAASLFGLAEVAASNHDDFEAKTWLNDSVSELANAGYAIPGLDSTDHSVERWIEAIPRGDDEDEVPFVRQFYALLTLHAQVAALQVKLMVSSEEAERHFYRLVDLSREAPAHTQAVQARLEAQLGLSSSPSDEAGDFSNRTAELQATIALATTLYDLAARSSASDTETIAHLHRMADDCIARARAFGHPITLAQALHAGAMVRQAADDFVAAATLYGQEYEQVAAVSGKPAADQALIALSALAKVQFAGLRDFKAASATVGKAISLIERDRYRVSMPFQQAALLAPYADLFTIGIFTAWKIATDPTALDRAGFDVMLERLELSKARASVRQLFLATALGAPDLDQQLRALNDAIHAHDPVMGPAEPTAEQQRKRNQARVAQQPLRRQRLQLWDRRAISRRNADGTMPPVTLARLQSALEPDEAIIYYYWLSPQALLVVTITAAEIAAERKLLTSEHRSLLERLIEVLGSLEGSNHGLEATFIEPLAPVLTPDEGRPLLAGKQRLIVSPHRLLHWYPFAAMPYQGQPLVRSFALRYAPNLASLLVPRPDPGAPKTAALAVSQFPGRPELGELRGVGAEAAEITATYSAASIPSQLIPEPTRAGVLAAMRDGRLGGAWCLHLGTHGHSLMDETSRDAPLESVLELADNSIDGYEIAAADLACEVVVLAACCAGQRAISGRGRAEQPGDELFGLGVAFLEARCRSVLAPAWPADDAAVSRIITAFHRNLARGAPADIALAQAQRAFLDTATLRERPAYYWAPLTLTAIGRPAPIPGTPA